MQHKHKLLIWSLGWILLLCSSGAQAGGGPSKGGEQGFFLQVDRQKNTAIFQPQGFEETKLVRLGEKISPNDIVRDKKVMVSLQASQDGPEILQEVSVMFIDMTWTKLLALLAIGLVGGLLSGFIGSGGAFVLTPSMMTLGAPGAVAVASNMCHKFPKSMVGAYKRYRYGQADIKLGLVMAVSAIGGVQLGIKLQQIVLDKWGNAGSNLYVSLAFVVILLVVGTYVLIDALKSGSGTDDGKKPRLAQAMQKIHLPPMIHFKRADVVLSIWVTVPLGLATGMLAATIAVGGFIGVPGLMYLVGASAVVASATELVIAFVMGLWGSIQWGLDGFIDIRLTLGILAASLIGVQIGALGTTYVRESVIKLVMGAVMLIVAVSRGAKIPGYLSDLDVVSLHPALAIQLDRISFWALVLALATAGCIITGAMAKGMLGSRSLRQQGLAKGTNNNL